jgi:hypothetical protein
MVIGSIAELKEHAEMMRKMPGMEHDEPNMITLKPGQRGGWSGNSTSRAVSISLASFRGTWKLAWSGRFW